MASLTLNWSLAGLAVLVFAMIYHYRDGRAIGTHARPDLETLPGGIPLLGHLYLVLKSSAKGSDPAGLSPRDRQVEWWSHQRSQQKDKSKTLTISLPFLRVIDGTQPDLIRHMQQTRLDVYEKGKITAELLRDVLGEGIFAVDGEKVCHLLSDFQGVSADRHIYVNSGRCRERLRPRSLPIVSV